MVFPLPVHKLELPPGYPNLVKDIKARIVKRRLQTIATASSEMILLYWEIGNEILKRQQNEGWGARIIDRLSYDIREAFTDMNGFSPRNLHYMRKFAEAWPDIKVVENTASRIPWRNNITLLDKLKKPEERLWYAQKALEFGFGKDMLAIQIDTKLHKRQAGSVNNFKAALPPQQSDMAAQMFKDPYIFDFIGTADPRREAELEDKLIRHIQKFLVELGHGFAFVGRQVHLELGGQDFYADLLFYHLKLRCYVVVELKTGKFLPEYVSKLNMYMNVVNDTLRHPDDKPCIGLLLVKTKNKILVEYALSGYKNPIGVADWEQTIIRKLPRNIKSSLPTIEEIEEELKSETNQ